MPPSLQKQIFSPTGHASLVASFDCGDEPWAREMNDWITDRSSDGVGRAIMEMQAEVWLYANENGILVGFGSLGSTRWRYPGPHDPRFRISIIPALAIRREFQGQPRDVPRHQRYAHLLVSDLIVEARAARGRP